MSTFDDFMISEVSQLRERHTKELALKNKQIDALETELAGCKQQLALVSTYEKMIAHNGAQEARIHELEAALRTICDPEKCAWTAGAMFHIAENALRGRQGTARDIQASGQMPGSAEVTLTCEVVDVAPKGIATESPAPFCLCAAFECHGQDSAAAHGARCRNYRSDEWHRLEREKYQ